MFFHLLLIPPPSSASKQLQRNQRTSKETTNRTEGGRRRRTILHLHPLLPHPPPPLPSPNLPPPPRPNPPPHTPHPLYRILSSPLERLWQTLHNLHGVVPNTHLTSFDSVGSDGLEPNPCGPNTFHGGICLPYRWDVTFHRMDHDLCQRLRRGDWTMGGYVTRSDNTPGRMLDDRLFPFVGGGVLLWKYEYGRVLLSQISEFGGSYLHRQLYGVGNDERLVG